MTFASGSSKALGSDVYTWTMGVISATDLKQKTGDFIRRLRAGEAFVLTYRGRRIGVIKPSKTDRGEVVPGNADDAWAQVDAALDASTPTFDDWQGATAWVRGRRDIVAS